MHAFVISDLEETTVDGRITAERNDFSSQC